MATFAMFPANNSYVFVSRNSQTYVGILRKNFCKVVKWGVLS